MNAQGPGRNATTPLELSARGWWQILKRTAKETADDNLSVIAAGVAFYALLALFPALGAGISVWGLFADPTHVTGVVDVLSGALPREAISVVSGELRRLVDADQGSLTIGSLVGLLVSLWSASAGTKALLTGLNIAYEEKEERSMVMFQLQALGFTIGLLLTGMVAVAGIIAGPMTMELLGLGDTGAMLLKVLRWPALAGLLMVVLATLYRFGPCRRAAQWQWVTPGSLAACVLWLVASAGLSLYADKVGSYGDTYGSLAGVVLLMLWLWVSAMVILLGAELNAESEHQTRYDTTRPPDMPMGERGAYVADHLAEMPSSSPS